MRFIPNGPDVPEELLVARDKGDVIFFCGAGVSQANAHLPNFERLGTEVIRVLGSALDSPARRLLTRALEMGRMAGVGGLVATDRVFGLLEREFEVRDVRAAVAEAIRPPEGYRLDAHRLLLDLATSRTGVTRLVTTNFDLLFEECDPELLTWGPPRLPDPRNDREFRGIVHLHGRVDLEYTRPQDDEFVISSADFGRAYLADGWATRFIQSLLSRYQIAFVGYTADDPPVQYLLEALNLAPGSRKRLFAFQAGDAGEASALWEHRGVHAIPFDNSNGFSPLWDTLAAWGDRARDVDGWYGRLLRRAADGPSAVDGHFRGQVAKVASTREGAGRIAAAQTTLDARWLLVLDPVQRYASPEKIEPNDNATEIFDPFQVLGLDLDTVPEPAEPENPFSRRELPDEAFDPLKPNRSDEDDRAEVPLGSLRGGSSSSVSAMPPRLFSLGAWIECIAHEPITLWWAAHQSGLHPRIQQGIEGSIRQSPERFPKVVRTGWRLLFSSWSDQRKDPDLVRYELEARAQRDGWSPSLGRDWAAMYRPGLKVDHAFDNRNPLQWRGQVPARLILADVDYPRPHQPLPVPDEFLPYAVAQFRGNFELAIALELEVTGHNHLYFGTSRADDGAPELDEDAFGLTGLIIYFQKLMDRWARIDLDAARAEISRWPRDDQYIFARLRIWAASRPDLFAPPEAAAIFLELPDVVFWGSLHQRDLLYALRDRWAELPADGRREIEARLRTGSFPRSNDVSGGVESAAAFDRLNRLHWLSAQGATFSFDLQRETAQLRQAAPHWSPDAGDEAADSRTPKAFSVDIDDSADALIDVPISEILSHAREAGQWDFRGRLQREPFRGLAKRRPVKALMALSHARRQGDAPSRPWTDFLHADTRKDDGVRMIRAIATELCHLPIEGLRGIAHPVAQWMEQISDRLFGDAAETLPNVWNRLIEALMLGGTTRQRRGARADLSWADDALNGPVGTLMSLLLKDPASKNLTLGAGYPRYWIEQLRQLLNLPGDLRRQALVMCGYQLRWLFAIDPTWTQRSLLPVCEDGGHDGNAFWDGIFWAAPTLSHELFLRLKSGLIGRATRPRARRGHGNIIAQMLLAGWGGEGDAEEPERLISDIELREVLIHADDELRSQVIWNLDRWSTGNVGRWRQRILPFLKGVWPKQRALRNATVSARLIDLAVASGDLMPPIVEIIVPRLVPISGGLRTFALRSDSQDFPARQYPLATLDLLWAALPEDPRDWPYKIEAVLEILETVSETSGDARLSELRRRRER